MLPADPSNNDFRIIPLSDRSLLVSFGNIISPEINERVLSLHQTLLLPSFEGFVESVPAYASLAVFYDLKKIKGLAQFTVFDYVKKYITGLLQQKNPGITPAVPIKRIPVCYHPDFGLDSFFVAANYRLSIDELAALHASVIYRVYMIGFMPGFAYMGAVNYKLISPRKNQPRLNVPAGSIGIAGTQTGIYPVESPGGWQIIGKTPLRLFDKERLSPCLLSPGDQVQFFPITKNEFENADAS